MRIVHISDTHNRLRFNVPELVKSLFGSIIVLIDAGVEIDGLRFYGFPWQAGMATNFNGFTLPPGSLELSSACNGIPQDFDVLITHGGADPADQLLPGIFFGL